MVLFSTVIGLMLQQAPPAERSETNPFPIIDLVRILADNPRRVRIWLAKSIPQQVWRPAVCMMQTTDARTFDAELVGLQGDEGCKHTREAS